MDIPTFVNELKSDTVEEYGRRWNKLTPRNDISWFVGRLHVSTPYAKVAASVKRKCKGPGYTSEIIQAAMDYAVIVHKANRDLFNHYRF